MIVPHNELSPDALEAVIEEFVTRDGTELSEASTKLVAVRRALDLGELVLVFDPESCSCNLVDPRSTSALDAPTGSEAT